MTTAEDLYKKFRVPAPENFSNNLIVHIAEAKGDLRLILAHQLEKLGFTKIQKSRDGKESVAMLKANPADIVLAGDDLPSVNGIDLLRDLREDPSMVRGAFVLISKPLNKDEVMLVVEAGVNDVLVRPITANDIMPKVRSGYINFANPKNPDRLYEEAKRHIKDKHIEIAKAIYASLSELNPAIARPYVGLARVAMLENSIDLALKYATEAVTKNPNFVHAYTIRAEIYLKLNQMDNAIADLKKAVTLSPLNVNRLENCCEVLLKAKLMDACIEILNKSIQAGLKHPFITERLGYSYFLNKDFTNAIVFLEEAVKLDPENTSFLNSMAICYRDALKYDLAINTYNKIIKKEPENTAVLFNKALVLIYSDQKNDALKLLKRILKMKPEFTKAEDKFKELEKELGLTEKFNEADDDSDL